MFKYNVLVLFLLTNLVYILFLCNAEKIRFISTEHPSVTYVNPKYASYGNLTSRRYSHDDPFYYVGLHVYTIVGCGNNISVHFYFYELLTNVYKRGFVEMHFKFCDLIHKNKFFGTALKQQANFSRPCPYPPGPYHAENMTIPLVEIPRGFPFTKGRIYCNITVAATEELVGSGYIDMEIKEVNMKRKKDKNKGLI